jgi:hypothetical protein
MVVVDGVLESEGTKQREKMSLPQNALSLPDTYQVSLLLRHADLDCPSTVLPVQM